MEAKLSVAQKPITLIYKRRYPYLNAIRVYLKILILHSGVNKPFNLLNG